MRSPSGWSTSDTLAPPEACALTLETGLIHPTANYEHPDPACALPGISAQVQQRPVKVALLNAFGFGSNNAAVVFRRATD